MKDGTSRGGGRFSARARGPAVAAAVLLAAALAGMANYLSARHYALLDWTRSGYYTPSAKTCQMLAGLTETVNVVAFLRPDHELAADVRNVLNRYARESPRLKLEFVDPDRDLARAKELAMKYDLSEANTIVFEASGRKRYVPARSLMEYDYSPLLAGLPKRAVSFRAEELFSTAILSVAESKPPVVYLLGGHGEREAEDYRPREGYSSVARLIRRDDVDMRALRLGGSPSIPDDCSALIVAGPRTPVPPAQVDAIRAYLHRNGRVLLLLDAGARPGLESLLADWGVRAGNEKVVDKAVLGVRVSESRVVGLALTGEELYVSRYGKHPITRRLRNVTTVFYLPRPIEPLALAEGSAPDSADKPRVTVLAESSPEGWGESDAEQKPPRFDPGADRKGPVPIAVAVEKVPAAGIDVELKSARMVVVGDSTFVADDCLVAGNGDFFMSALNWLLERESLMAVAPKPPQGLAVTVSRKQGLLLFVVACVAMPGLGVLLGLGVWIRRKM